MALIIKLCSMSVFSQSPEKLSVALNDYMLLECIVLYIYMVPYLLSHYCLTDKIVSGGFRQTLNVCIISFILSLPFPEKLDLKK